MWSVGIVKEGRKLKGDDDMKIVISRRELKQVLDDYIKVAVQVRYEEETTALRAARNILAVLETRQVKMTITGAEEI